MWLRPLESRFRDIGPALGSWRSKDDAAPPYQLCLVINRLGIFEVIPCPATQMLGSLWSGIRQQGVVHKVDHVMFAWLDEGFVSVQGWNIVSSVRFIATLARKHPR